MVDLDQKIIAGQKVIEIYQKAPSKQNSGLECLLYCNAFARLLDVMGSL